MLVNKRIKAVLLGALLVLGVTAWAQAQASGLWSQGEQTRSLSFYNTHTHEKLDVTYWRNGRYDMAALEQINIHMRDHRRGTHIAMSRDTINYIHDIKTRLQERYPHQDIRFHIISGYRSPETNNMLRARGGGQAKQSRHMFGDAIDFRVPGIKLSEIRDIAWCLQRGGVGYYKGSDFIHVDAGAVRYWNWTPNASTCSGKQMPAS